MKTIATFVGTFFLVPLLAYSWTASAKARLAEAEASPSQQAEAATAASADEAYCTPELKKILRRVLQSCGLESGGGGRWHGPAGPGHTDGRLHHTPSRFLWRRRQPCPVCPSIRVQ